MSALTGIKSASYLASFLGRKIAIQDAHDRNKYYLYPKLFAIFCNGLVMVEDKNHEQTTFEWEQCESPYVVLDSDKEIVLK